MVHKDIAVMLGELIEADAEEQASLEKLLDQYGGVVGFFKQLEENEEMPLSTESLEKLRALQSLMDILTQRDATALEEGSGYEPAPHQ